VGMCTTYNMHKIQVLFFASLKDQIGSNRLEIELPEGATVAALKKHLLDIQPGLGSIISNLSVSINQGYAFDNDIIPANAEVALFPPVSGGSEFPTIVKITEEPLNQDKLVRKITIDSTGDCCIFCGIVRGVTQGNLHRTQYLEYEAYIPMAELKMVQIAEEIRKKWPTIQGIAIVQRIGHLEPGIPTVFIGCASAHRNTGVFDAVRYGIDRLKEIVPIWKKEVDDSGASWIEGDYQPKRGD